MIIKLYCGNSCQPTSGIAHFLGFPTSVQESVGQMLQPSCLLVAYFMKKAEPRTLRIKPKSSKIFERRFC